MAEAGRGRRRLEVCFCRTTATAASRAGKGTARSVCRLFAATATAAGTADTISGTGAGRSEAPKEEVKDSDGTPGKGPSAAADLAPSKGPGHIKIRDGL